LPFEFNLQRYTGEQFTGLLNEAGLYKLCTQLTHSLNARLFPTLEPVKVKTWFQSFTV
jgi:hypothetical protein